MSNTQIKQDINRIHLLVEALGYGEGLGAAHRILGTERYHAAFGPWEIQDKIITRHNNEPIVVNHWTARDAGSKEETWVLVVG